MTVHHHSKVNPLVNPVSAGDIVCAESGESYEVKQTMNGEYFLRHVQSSFDLCGPLPGGQVAICRKIAELANI